MLHVRIAYVRLPLRADALGWAVVRLCLRVSAANLTQHGVVHLIREGASTARK